MHIYGLPIVGIVAIAGKICSGWIRSLATCFFSTRRAPHLVSSQINWLPAKIYSEQLPWREHQIGFSLSLSTIGNPPQRRFSDCF